MSSRAPCLPNRYELVFDVCGPSSEKLVSMTGFNAPSTTDHMSCGISTSDLKMLSQRVENAVYITSETGGAILIIRDGVERIGGPDLLKSLLKEQNRLVDELLGMVPEYGSRISFYLNDTPSAMTPKTTQLNHHLESWFAYLNPPRIGNGYKVRCHLGGPTTLTVGSKGSSKEYGLNNGDLYLVSEPFSAQIGRQ